MKEITYIDSPYNVRSEFAECHTSYWKRLAAAGTWLSGAERVAIAEEVRSAGSCKLCSQRKTALSPYQVDGSHDTVSDLSDTMVEVVHRVVTDSARLTKNWFDGIIQQGITVEQYIEVISTLVNVMAIDGFCRGLNIPLKELPESKPGEPSNYRPQKVIEGGDGAWVPLLPAQIDSGPEADLWNERAPYVIRALSLVPDELRAQMTQISAHYVNPSKIFDFKSAPNSLSRIQMEVIAARMSALNGCFY